jgi:hypothetical protein
MSLCSMNDGRSSRARSAISNDVLKLRGIDGRSRGGRRFRDLVHAYAGDVGGIGAVTEAQRSLITQAASLQISVEALQARMVAGEAVDPEVLVRLANVQLRALGRSGCGRAASRQTARRPFSPTCNRSPSGKMTPRTPPMSRPSPRPTPCETVLAQAWREVESNRRRFHPRILFDALPKTKWRLR